MNQDAPVLICFDGSEEARQAVADAGRLLGGGPAIVLTTWEFVTAPIGGQAIEEFAAGMPVQEVDDASREQATRTAAEGARLAGAHGFAAEPAVQAGPAAAAIVETAQRRGAKAIVIGSHGRTGIRGAVMGSVSNAVIHHAPCPVLVSRRAD